MHTTKYMTQTLGKNSSIAKSFLSDQLLLLLFLLVKEQDAL